MSEAFANPGQHFVHSVRWRLHYARRLVREAAERHRAAEFYRPLIRRNALVFDIGGNVGSRAILFAHMGASVVTLEPVRATYAKLAANVAGMHRVTALHMGASDHNGTATIRPCDLSPCASMEPDWVEAQSPAYPGTAWHPPEVISVTTLDALIEEYGVPAFIKIDVEGHELAVLRGLSSPVPALSYEYTPRRIRPAFECMARLEELAPHEYNYSVGESFELGLPRYVSAEEFRPILERLGNGPLHSGDIYAVLGDAR